MRAEDLARLQELIRLGAGDPATPSEHDEEYEQLAAELEEDRRRHFLDLNDQAPGQRPHRLG